MAVRILPSNRLPLAIPVSLFEISRRRFLSETRTQMFRMRGARSTFAEQWHVRAYVQESAMSGRTQAGCLTGPLASPERRHGHLGARRVPLNCIGQCPPNLSQDRGGTRSQWRYQVMQARRARLRTAVLLHQAQGESIWNRQDSQRSKTFLGNENVIVKKSGLGHVPTQRSSRALSN